MTESDTKFEACFRPLFEKKGMEDIKLFLRPDHAHLTGGVLRTELQRMQEAASRGTKRLDVIDRNIPKTRFDAPF